MIEKQIQPLPTTPDDLFKILKSLDISYDLHHHDPIFTVEQGEHLKENIPGTHCRNLFVRDKKGKMFLIVLANETQVDMKVLPTLLGCGRLSFGSAERLWNNLGIRPGSVCPFTAVNDTGHNVQVVLDAYMMAQDIVCYHPMDNAMTIGLSPADLLRFFAHTGHAVMSVDFYAQGSAPE